MRAKYCYAAIVAVMLVLWQMAPPLWGLDIPPTSPDVRVVFDPVASEWKLVADILDESVYIRQDAIKLNGDGHTIDGNWNGIVVSRADETITNVTIKNVTVANCPRIGIYVDGAADVHLENINASNNRTGISLQDTTDSTVAKTTAFANSAAGIDLFLADRIALTNNTCQNNGGAGVALEQSSDNVLESVVATYNNDGVLLRASSNNVVQFSVLTHNTWAGVAEVDGWANRIENNLLAYNYWAMYQENSAETDIVGNSFSNNLAYGFLGPGSWLIDFDGNSFERNPVAFSLNSDDGVTLYYNNFSNNGKTGELVDVHGFTCINNNFSDIPPVFDVVGGTDIAFSYNYHSNHITPDSDGDGFVDTSLLISPGVWANWCYTEEYGWVLLPPDIEVWPEEDMEITVELGGTQEAILTIANVGHEDSELHVNSVQLYWVAGDSDYHIRVRLYEWDGPATLKHGQTTQVKLIADATDCSDLGSTWYLMFIHSDDPDEHLVSVPVRVNVVAPPPPTTPAEAIQQLIDQVEALNLHNGIDNSLDAKLAASQRALGDLNENNDAAAVNALEAFINEVEAQRGKKILDDDADALIETAEYAKGLILI